jgi:hypothetical protein
MSDSPAGRRDLVARTEQPTLHVRTPHVLLLAVSLPIVLSVALMVLLSARHLGAGVASGLAKQGTLAKERVETVAALSSAANRMLPLAWNCDQVGLRIVEPSAGVAVPRRGLAKGDILFLPPGTRVWVLGRRADFGPRWWPQGEANVSDNYWSASVTYGVEADSGRAFDVAVMLVDERQHETLAAAMRTATPGGDIAPISVESPLCASLVSVTRSSASIVAVPKSCGAKCDEQYAQCLGADSSCIDVCRIEQDERYCRETQCAPVAKKDACRSAYRKCLDACPR